MQMLLCIDAGTESFICLFITDPKNLSHAMHVSKQLLIQNTCTLFICGLSSNTD